MPVYAYLAAGLGTLLGSWGAGAVVISLLAGFGASLALHRLLRDRIGDGAALWAVAFFACGPLAALFQVGYAESLFSSSSSSPCGAFNGANGGWLYVLVPTWGSLVPASSRSRSSSRCTGASVLPAQTDPLPRRDVVHVVALGIVAVAVGFSWQVLAAVVTGEPGAYLATELAWRRNWLGDAGGHFVPVEGWVQAAGFWFTQWGLGAGVGYVALVLLVLGVAAILLFAPQVKRLGVEVRLWSASYLIYLLLVFFPQSSIFRLLVPVSPLWGALAVPRSRAWRLTVLGVALLGQWWWIYNMYGLANTYWQIP